MLSTLTALHGGMVGCSLMREEGVKEEGFRVGVEVELVDGKYPVLEWLCV